MLLYIKGTSNCRGGNNWSLKVGVILIHRFDSFAPVEDGSEAQWFIDGKEAFTAIASSIESANSGLGFQEGFFVLKDYKMFPPSVDWDNINWSARRPQWTSLCRYYRLIKEKKEQYVVLGKGVWAS